MCWSLRNITDAVCETIMWNKYSVYRASILNVINCMFSLVSNSRLFVKRTNPSDVRQFRAYKVIFICQLNTIPSYLKSILMFLGSYPNDFIAILLLSRHDDQMLRFCLLSLIISQLSMPHLTALALLLTSTKRVDWLLTFA